MPLKRFLRWLKFQFDLPARKRYIDETILYPMIDQKAATPEQAEAAKRFHRWIDMQDGE